ncbi:MAG: Rap1a/Tai family immunity protein [Brevundimonas sp.]|uniref:Rap1a/Tai family immunity protein n=1 Tax=Brevundimonas sp. TaxID=1871086 RepID=UPI0026130A0B|nr:Rap1a/Tai family immunity protein [Brevundimonas sp.]MDI6623987.1 Rap1a/Tai family immunity protein [Brevundimonas sp.]MDQ7811376.1 Rap1a/Tai family immunity protein [Brevundimonas sp.]
MILAAALALAGFWSGNDLLETCRFNKGAGSTCTAYVMGVVDTEINTAGYQRRSQIFCIPDGATGVQLADVAVRYLESHPETRHASAAGLVQAAMVEAFACAA